MLILKCPLTVPNWSWFSPRFSWFRLSFSWFRPSLTWFRLSLSWLKLAFSLFILPFPWFKLFMFNHFYKSEINTQIWYFLSKYSFFCKIYYIFMIFLGQFPPIFGYLGYLPDSGRWPFKDSWSPPSLYLTPINDCLASVQSLTLRVLDGIRDSFWKVVTSSWIQEIGLGLI